jgi:hypothetical protein
MKRPRLVGCHGEGSTMEAHLLEALLQFDGAVNICSKDNTEAEVAIANVQPAEFLRLSKSGGNYLELIY